jgi:hypothetical protein
MTRPVEFLMKWTLIDPSGWTGVEAMPGLP